jgi:hypothetical protein
MVLSIEITLLQFFITSPQRAAPLMGGAPEGWQIIKSETMKVLIHHIYEYQKGLRNLALHTLPLECEEAATDKLRKYGIEYFIHNACGKRINVFFGAPECVAVICTICDGKKLHHLTPEEDFVLGSMLGYGMRQQCERYLKKSVPQDITLSVQKCA